MTCRKGDFYITIKGDNKKDFIAKKVSGYIIDDKIGFCRDEKGWFYPTELKTGTAVRSVKYDIYMQFIYCGYANLLNAYKVFVASNGYELIEQALKNPGKIMKKCLNCISMAYEAERTKK